MTAKWAELRNVTGHSDYSRTNGRPLDRYVEVTATDAATINPGDTILVSEYLKGDGGAGGPWQADPCYQYEFVVQHKGQPFRHDTAGLRAIVPAGAHPNDNPPERTIDVVRLYG